MSKSSAKARFEIIDGLRGLAMLWIMVSHVWIFNKIFHPGLDQLVQENFLFQWVGLGNLATDVFFLISGFLLGLKFLKPAISVNGQVILNFFKKRYQVLWPMLVLGMILALSLYADAYWKRLWANLLLIDNWVPRTPYPYTWFLAVLEQSLVFSLLFFLLIRRFKVNLAMAALVLLAALGLSQFAYLTFFYPDPLPFSHSTGEVSISRWFDNYHVITFFRIPLVLFGFFGAAWYHQKKATDPQANGAKPWDNLVVLLLLLLMFFISSLSFGDLGTQAHPVFAVFKRWQVALYIVLHRWLFGLGLLLLLLYALWQRGQVVRWVKELITWPFFKRLGPQSYALYLFHIPFMLWYFPRVSGWAQHWPWSNGTLLLAKTALCFGLVFVGAGAMYRWVELPLRRWAAK